MERERLHKLYSQLFPKVCNFVYARLKNSVYADDVTGEVFFKAIATGKSPSSRRGRTSGFACYGQIEFTRALILETEVLGKFDRSPEMN